MHASVLRRLLIALVALTVVALLWNRFGMESTLVIDPKTNFAIEALDDRASDGGNSVATIVRDGRQLGLDCMIAKGYQWPSCELLVRFRRAPSGIDLSGYDSVRLWITSTGPEKDQRLRLFLRNFNPAYSRVGDPQSQKVNELFFAPSQYPPGYEIELSRFPVAGWWTEEHPTTLDLSGPELDNVTSFAVATGSNLEPGLHQIRIQRIEFRGKAISASTFRLGIILLWMVTVVGYLVADTLLTRNQLRLSTASQTSLQRLNESLRLETRSLAEIARTDPLTGVLNRKGLADELLRLVRTGGDAIFPLTLVFIDIDHFKRVNDEHGHDIGDQVIKGLAALVRSAVQREDLFARWGGEEFLLVFRSTPGLEARTIAERLRERIADAHWPVSLRITCSFGVAEWHQGEDLERGVKRADEAMYRAKQNGRDRVELQLDVDAGAAGSDFGGLTPL
jgi:diguanylate cyclase (GGDEF)-like protein